MPPPVDDFTQLCIELLQSLGLPVRMRRMFGGRGYYADDLFVALSFADRLYLKTDDDTRARFAAAAGEPFVYQAADGRDMTISYWTVPAEAMESPALMQPWARLALEAALRARAAKAPAQRRKTAAAPSAAAAKPPARKAAPRKAATGSAAGRPKR